MCSPEACLAHVGTSHPACSVTHTLSCDSSPSSSQNPFSLTPLPNLYLSSTGQSASLLNESNIYLHCTKIILQHILLKISLKQAFHTFQYT